MDWTAGSRLMAAAGAALLTCSWQTITHTLVPAALPCTGLHTHLPLIPTDIYLHRSLFIASRKLQPLCVFGNDVKRNMLK